MSRTLLFNGIILFRNVLRMEVLTIVNGKTGYCFKKCVSDKRKKSTDFLDLQEIKTTKTKKV